MSVKLRKSSVYVINSDSLSKWAGMCGFGGGGGGGLMGFGVVMGRLGVYYSHPYLQLRAKLQQWLNVIESKAF